MSFKWNGMKYHKKVNDRRKVANNVLHNRIKIRSLGPSQGFLIYSIYGIVSNN